MMATGCNKSGRGYGAVVLVAVIAFVVSNLGSICRNQRLSACVSVAADVIDGRSHGVGAKRSGNTAAASHAHRADHDANGEGGAGTSSGVSIFMERKRVSVIRAHPGNSKHTPSTGSTEPGRTADNVEYDLLIIHAMYDHPILLIPQHSMGQSFVEMPHQVGSSSLLPDSLGDFVRLQCEVTEDAPGTSPHVETWYTSDITFSRYRSWMDPGSPHLFRTLGLPQMASDAVTALGRFVLAQALPPSLLRRQAVRQEEGKGDFGAHLVFFIVLASRGASHQKSLSSSMLWTPSVPVDFVRNSRCSLFFPGLAAQRMWPGTVAVTRKSTSRLDSFTSLSLQDVPVAMFSLFDAVKTEFTKRHGVRVVRPPTSSIFFDLPALHQSDSHRDYIRSGATDGRGVLVSMLEVQACLKVIGAAMKKTTSVVMDSVTDIVMGGAEIHMTSEITAICNDRTPTQLIQLVETPLRKNISYMITDAVTATVVSTLSKSITNDLGPYIHDKVVEHAVPKLHELLHPLLTYAIGEDLIQHVPEALERALPRTVVQRLNHALPYAIVPTMSLSLALQRGGGYGEWEQCAACFYGSEKSVAQCSLCRGSTASMYYASYYGAYFAGFYADYYTPYYVAALAAIDEVQYGENEDAK